MTAWPEVCRGSRSVSTIVGHGGEWGGAGGRVVGGWERGGGDVWVGEEAVAAGKHALTNTLTC